MQALYAAKQSIIHQTDARVKIIFTLAFVIFLNLTPSGAWPSYVLFLSVLVSLTLLSQLGLVFVLKRSLLALPFMLAALPLIFTGPGPLTPISLSTGGQLFYSTAGLVRFGSIAIKSWMSVWAAIILAASTRFPDFLLGLQQLKMPKILVGIIGLMWRYLFLIRDEAIRMMNARKSRSTASLVKSQAGGTLLWRARVTGGMAGNLFLRSIERSDRVYVAMLSRGYNGEQKTLSSTSISRQEWVLLAAGFGLLLLLWLLGMVTAG